MCCNNMYCRTDREKIFFPFFLKTHFQPWRPCDLPTWPSALLLLPSFSWCCFSLKNNKLLSINKSNQAGANDRRDWHEQNERKRKKKAAVFCCWPEPRFVCSRQIREIPPALKYLPFGGWFIPIASRNEVIDASTPQLKEEQTNTTNGAERLWNFNLTTATTQRLWED